MMGSGWVGEHALGRLVRCHGLPIRDERRAHIDTFNPAFLGDVATHIGNAAKGINPFTSKPAAITEWE